MDTWKRWLVTLGRGLAHPRLWRFLLHPLTRYVVAWTLTLAGAGALLYVAWILFDDQPNPEHPDHVRRDGNRGHCTIDFGGQYLMGRMVVRGYGRHLYHRNYQRQVLQESYPRADEDPFQDKSDAENLMIWTMGEDDPDAGKVIASLLVPMAAVDAPELAGLLAASAPEWTESQLRHVTAEQIGGPLYPPVHALYFYPLAFLKPATAYRVTQIINLLLAFAAGWGIRLLSQGRIWWPVATGMILAFPGFDGSLDLGQNASLTLAIVVLGWTLIARGYLAGGGAVWGLLAFKPVWAMSFFLVPVLTRRWRVCLAMIAVGITLAAVTLPIVGWRSWFEWYEVGKKATAVYKYDKNWIFLSRDVLSIPRRALDFDHASVEAREKDVPTAIIGWALLGGIFAITLGLAYRYRDRPHTATGPEPAFLLLGSWLCCFHFMYYDVLLAALPVLLLLTEPRRYLQPLFLALVPLNAAQLGEKQAHYYRPGFPTTYPPAPPTLTAGYGNVWVLNSMTLTLFALLLATAYVLPIWDIGVYGFPWDTVCLVALWLWCGWLWSRQPAPSAPPTPSDVPSRDGQMSASSAHAPQLPQLSAGVRGAH